MRTIAGRIARLERAEDPGLDQKTWGLSQMLAMVELRRARIPETDWEPHIGAPSWSVEPGKLTPFEILEDIAARRAEREARAGGVVPAEGAGNRAVGP